MYTGKEEFVFNGAKPVASMLSFWQWTLSCIFESATRGSVAEYIVKLALDYGGINKNPDGKTGMESYDLKGPVMKSNGNEARIEVKSTGYFHVNPHVNPEKGYKETAKQQFNIAKKTAADETGDFKDGAPKQRNNDIYVCAVYNGKKPGDEIFDLSRWDFYVIPTNDLNNDPVYHDRQYIQLKVVQERYDKLTFDEIADAVRAVCDSI